MSSLVLSALYVYPVKSLGGLSVPRWPVGVRGPELDRRWMLVDPDGAFLSQRRLPRMTLVSARPRTGQLRLSAPGMPELVLPLDCGTGAEREVVVWRDRCIARDAGDEAAEWLGRFLDTSCRLVCLPDDRVRAVDPEFARPGDEVGFADGFPFLVISRASLDDLNARLPEPLSMVRFRPNLVIDGATPYAEDGWRRIRVGALELRLVKPCSRCTVPTVDPTTGERGPEPLRTLTGYRRRDNKVYFGQNAVHEGTGELAVGDPVEVLE